MYKVNEKVWFYNTWNGITSGVIEECHESFCKVKWDIGGTSSIPINYIFKTQNDIMEWLKKYKSERVIKYLLDLNTIEDVIKFSISYMYDAGNDDAIKAVKTRTKELLNIDTSEW